MSPAAAGRGRDGGLCEVVLSFLHVFVYCRLKLSTIDHEIASQPSIWRRTEAFVAERGGLLPAAGERVALIGCGTSYYVAQALASLREGAGLGESDAFAASEWPAGRRYDRVVAISRSGTTTEVVRALEASPGNRRLAITALADAPVTAAAEAALVLDFADEEAVVQTRFATAVLALGRAWCGQPLEPAAAAAEAALTEAPPAELGERDHFVFLGRGWTVGLAAEAALKVRECAGAWAEAYAAMEYRHGPISAASERSLVWALGEVDPAVLAAARATGATVRAVDADPMAELVQAQRLAVAKARAVGRDPDFPVHLTRSVVLT